MKNVRTKWSTVRALQNAISLTDATGSARKFIWPDNSFPCVLTQFSFSCQRSAKSGASRSQPRSLVVSRSIKSKKEFKTKLKESDGVLTVNGPYEHIDRVILTYGETVGRVLPLFFNGSQKVWNQIQTVPTGEESRGSLTLSLTLPVLPQFQFIECLLRLFLQTRVVFTITRTSTTKFVVGKALMACFRLLFSSLVIICRPRLGKKGKAAKLRCSSACAARDQKVRRTKAEEEEKMSLKRTKMRLFGAKTLFFFYNLVVSWRHVIYACKYQLPGRTTDEAASFEVMLGRTASSLALRKHSKHLKISNFYQGPTMCHSYFRQQTLSLFACQVKEKSTGATSTPQVWAI